MSITQAKYTGSALPGNAEVVDLFDSTVAFPYAAKALVMAGISRIRVSLKNDQAGTLALFRSPDRGTTWLQIDSDAIAAAAATAENVMDYVVEGYEDVRIRWTNGVAAQTTFNPVVALITNRSATS